MKKYPLFRKENIKSYAVIMAIWLMISMLSGGLLSKIGSLSFAAAFGWAAATAMFGMGIMFGASVLNLRKLSPGFERLAKGEADPQIPPVWCPVLTAATNAALELASRKQSPVAPKTN